MAVAARGGSGSTPPPKPLAQAIHDALGAAEPAGVTARIDFTNKLFPSGALTGQAGSALMTGASGRLWANANGGRLELQSDAGDAQIVWNDTKVTVYDASSNTAYVADLPKNTSGDTTAHRRVADARRDHDVPHRSRQALDGLRRRARRTSRGQEAYTVTVSPSHDGGLLGSAELAWDATHGTPLKIAVYAQGSSSPVLALQATDISFGSVPDVRHRGRAAGRREDRRPLVADGQQLLGRQRDAAPVTGLAAVQAAAPFTVVAPDTLVGLPRQDVRLVGPADSQSVLVGLRAGARRDRRRRAQARTPPKAGQAGMLDALPSISLDGVTAHELATQLGTVLGWDSGGVSYVLAGSIPTAAAESAARSLK